MTARTITLVCSVSALAPITRIVVSLSILLHGFSVKPMLSLFGRRL